MTYDPWLVCFDEWLGLFVDPLHYVWTGEVLNYAASVFFDGTNDTLDVRSWEALDTWFFESHIEKCLMQRMRKVSND